MFDFETIVKIGALIIALGLLLSTIDLSYFFTKVLKREKVVKVDMDVENDFIKTLQVWYTLKTQCDKLNLTAASAKLDEVFPLLNDGLEVKDNNNA